MNQKIKSIINFILFLLALVIITSIIGRYLMANKNYAKYQGFYDEKSEFDVLFFGSSKVLDGIQPMQIWKEYGITSYNMAQHAEDLVITYWQMKNAFKYNAPKVAVIDISLFSHIPVNDEALDDTKAYLHKSLDHMPLTNVKIQAIRALTEGYSDLDFYFPIAMYHNRWEENLDDISEKKYVRMKGAETRLHHFYNEKQIWTDEAVEGFNPDAINVGKIIELCDEYNVIPIFICIPAGETGIGATNSFEKYFKEKNQIFINICRDEDFMNYATDFADVGHMNPSGSKKLTAYLGEYLFNNYNFEDKTDKTIKAWDESYQSFLKAKEEDLQTVSETDEFEAFLALLINERDFDYWVIKNSSEKRYNDLLSELDSDKIVIDESIEQVTVTIFCNGKEISMTN